jgi:uncharacterized membrane protein YdjX (TVP38/TMEM64 family)
MNKYNYRKFSKNIFLAILLVVFIYLFSTIDKETLEQISVRLGWLGPLFIGLVFVFTHVFAPISGTPFYLVGIQLYGYETILILFYCTSMISATICFFIARKWRRKIVTKLVGEKMMANIDDTVSFNESSILITGRTLGYCFFEFTSYALGLTTISFKKYIAYTAVLTPIPMLLLYLVFKNLDFDSFQDSMIYYSTIAISGVLFAFFLSHIIKKRKKATK